MKNQNFNTIKKILFTSIFIVFGYILFAQTKTELKTEELQKPIREYITKNFQGYSIDQVFKVDAKGVITYDICINKDNVYEKIFFDKEGRFLRKESCTLDCCQAPPKK